MLYGQCTPTISRYNNKDYFKATTVHQQMYSILVIYVQNVRYLMLENWKNVVKL